MRLLGFLFLFSLFAFTLASSHHRHHSKNSRCDLFTSCPPNHFCSRNECIPKHERFQNLFLRPNKPKEKPMGFQLCALRSGECMAGGVCPENYKCISDNTCWMVRATRREMDVTAEERRFKRSHLYMGVCMNLIGPCQEGSCPSGFTCRVDNNCWSTNVEVPAN